jgi:hypothetical protein
MLKQKEKHMTDSNEKKLPDVCHEDIVTSLFSAIWYLEDVKPNDKSEKDRKYAILRTQIQLVLWAAIGMRDADAAGE